MRPTLRSRRLLLRPPVEGDAHAIYRACRDPALARWTSSIPVPYTIDHARDFIAFCADHADTHANYAITDADTGTLLGMVGLIIDSAHAHAELGYWIAREHWNRGYATEACRTLLDHAFADLGLERIFAGYFAGNEASWQVQRKLGFRREGIQRSHLLRMGRRHDLVLCAILRQEWGRLDPEPPFTPDLRTPRLHLRPPTADDLLALTSIWSCEQVACAILSIPHPLSPEAARDRLDELLASASRREMHHWAITLDARIVGEAGLSAPDAHARSTLGYVLHPDHWNKGIMTEALAEICSWALRHRNPPIERITADTFPWNTASMRVLEKLGFSREGVLRAFVRKQNTRHDVVRFARLRSDEAHPTLEPGSDTRSKSP